MKHNAKDVPVSVFIATSIIVIFSMYVSTAIKQIPCGKDIFSKFYSNFVHVDTPHLIFNLIAIYALSRVELDIGSTKFIGLITFLVILITILETIVYTIFKDLPCSVGFSGVLFGVLVWELITKKGLDLLTILPAVGLIFVSKATNPKSSLIGHSIGAISGLICGALWIKVQ